MEQRTKFNVSNKKDDRTFDGIVFDSALEMRYYRDVLLPGVKDGTIVYYERQKKYILQQSFKHDGKRVQPIEYKSDFYIEYKNGTKVVVDIKGCPDAVAKLKRKMFWFIYPELNYVWIGYSRIDGGFVTYETIQRGRQQRKKAKKEKKE